MVKEFIVKKIKKMQDHTDTMFDIMGDIHCFIQDKLEEALWYLDDSEIEENEDQDDSNETGSYCNGCMENYSGYENSSTCKGNCKNCSCED